MKKIIKRNRYIIIIVIIAALAAAGFSVYRGRSTKLLDKAAFKEFRAAFSEASDPEVKGFADQQELRDYIKNWADEKGLEYSEDKAGNLIFARKAVKRKKNVSPTLVCMSMNYETAHDNASLYASAASIALSDLESGRRTVVFVNDEQNLAAGYKSLSKKLITDKTKVIYLDQGSSMYMSTGSFQERFADITVPAAREEAVGDTTVKVTISGIPSGVVGPGISRQPDPVAAFSSLITRLQSKSVVYSLADLSLGSNGNMYPVSLEATFTMDSYAAASFTSYINKRIKSWNKEYGKNGSEMTYTYEVNDDPEKLPEKAYSSDTADKLAGVLYTVKCGTYRYASSDAIPEGKEAGDTYGINCILGIDAGNKKIVLKLMTQGYNDSFTDRIMYDNTAASELYGCSYEQTETIRAFINDRDSLSRTFKNTYLEISDSSTLDSELAEQNDNFFTPCSYLAANNSKADIIHLRINASGAAKASNAVLLYIKTKGNKSIF